MKTGSQYQPRTGSYVRPSTYSKPSPSFGIDPGFSYSGGVDPEMVPSGEEETARRLLPCDTDGRYKMAGPTGIAVGGSVGGIIGYFLGRHEILGGLLGGLAVFLVAKKLTIDCDGQPR